MDKVETLEVDPNWRIPDSLWESIEPLLPLEMPKPEPIRILEHNLKLF
jgi:hypothetical protein